MMNSLALKFPMFLRRIGTWGGQWGQGHRQKASCTSKWWKILGETWPWRESWPYNRPGWEGWEASRSPWNILRKLELPQCWEISTFLLGKWMSAWGKGQLKFGKNLEAQFWVPRNSLREVGTPSRRTGY